MPRCCARWRVGLLSASGVASASLEALEPEVKNVPMSFQIKICGLLELTSRDGHVIAE